MTDTTRETPTDIKAIMVALRVASRLWPFAAGHDEGEGMPVDLVTIPALLREAERLLRQYVEVEWF
jgi:hypothetical protein